MKTLKYINHIFIDLTITIKLLQFHTQFKQLSGSLHKYNSITVSDHNTLQSYTL